MHLRRKKISCKSQLIEDGEVIVVGKKLKRTKLIEV